MNWVYLVVAASCALSSISSLFTTMLIFRRLDEMASAAATAPDLARQRQRLLRDWVARFD